MTKLLKTEVINFDACLCVGYSIDESLDFMAELYTQDFVESIQNGKDLILDYIIPIK